MGTLQVAAFVGAPPLWLTTKGPLMSARKRGFGTVITVLLVVVLAAVIGYGAWLGLSARRVGALLEQTNAAYELVQADIEREDYTTALVDIRTVAGCATELSAELDGLQWEIASKLPVVGTDVEVARTTGHVSGTLSSDAVLPVLDAWDELMGSGVIEDGVIDADAISNKLSQVSALVTSLETAGTVIDECSAEMKDLPTSHFEQLNAFASELRGAISSADEAMEGIEATIGIYRDLSSIVSGLFGSSTGETSATEAPTAETPAA